MNELDFWRQKLIQFFHDPPAKPFAGNARVGTQKKVANDLFDAFQKHNRDRKLRHWYKPADWAASGADRPMLYTPKQKGVSTLGMITWPKQPEITHPLSPGCRLHINITQDLPEAPDAYQQDEEAEQTPPERDPVAEQKAFAEKLADEVSDWRDAEQLRRSYFALWRRYREDLALAAHAGKDGTFKGDPLWEEMPAETRCPDHSIWDHLKATTALAFMKDHKLEEAPKDRDHPQEPWMLSFALGPTQQFIEQSRTSRDLWISSFLLADLAWHAMEPFVQAYGPDCIVYPDLRANPRADCWLFDHHPLALSDETDDPRRNPSTFAAVLPTKFVALVPRGGEGVLTEIKKLATTAETKVKERWQALAGRVHTWFRSLEIRGGKIWDDKCQEIWERQHRHPPIHCTWAAVPWRHMGRIEDPESLRGRALPAQEPGFRQPADATAAERDHKAIEARRERLAPWVPMKVWAHYENAREVFARSMLKFHQMERGFDYALTHHMLGVRHELRKATDPAPVLEDEPGEKCTLCGQREALRRGSGKAHSLDGIRAQACAFWKHKKLDPDETGAERLCAVCAVKRFLVEADQDGEKKEVGSFNRLWFGMNPIFDEAPDSDKEFRVPFPSTATIATQRFLAEIVGRDDLKPHIAKVVSACRAAQLPRTSFPRALPRLAVAFRRAGKAGNTDAVEFLKYEAQDVVLPETADGKAQAAKARGEGAAEQKMSRLKAAVQELRTAAKKKEKEKDIPSPSTRIAVIRLDGDSMGKLLLGDPEVIGTTWRDVLHPEVLERLNGRKQNEHLLKAGWGDLLDSKRLMGPSLHAFVSRALGHFSHRIVPWVVEQEFSGRLIYSGGDDVLCIAPADEALNLAARLQQLFSAPWVVDMQPPDDENWRDQWAWRRNNWTGGYDQTSARQRFVVPVPRMEGGKPQPIRLGVSEDEQPLQAHTAGGVEAPAWVEGALLPMLGSAASLSAGIAIGHYKTPLSVLLRRSRGLLDYAKNPFPDRRADAGGWKGRCALAIAHASRGGEKTRFAMPWGSGSGGGNKLDAHATLRTVSDAFKSGQLPGRLPYKLRELALSTRCGLERIREDGGTAEEQEKRRHALLAGLFGSCLEGSADTPAAKAAFRLWEQGIRLHERAAPAASEDTPVMREPPEANYTDGLLLCRELARGGDEGEGEE